MRLPKWENIAEYLARQVPGLFPVIGSKDIKFVIGAGGKSLALRLSKPDGFELIPSPFRELKFDIKLANGKAVIELATETSELFNAFYLFACGIVDAMEDKNSAPGEAIALALESFDRLFSKRQLMSESEQLGLFGELDFLSALLRVRGPNSMSAWLGPIPERHDFRFGALELEVKSTTNGRRIHTIHGVEQLLASPGKELFLLSLQYERAGADSGLTLPNLVDQIVCQLNAGASLKKIFLAYLQQVGYRSTDSEYYDIAWQLRSKPMLVAVDETCPRITPAELMAALSPPSQQRVLHVEYRIDVTSLGIEEGAQAYEKVLPGIRLTEKN